MHYVLKILIQCYLLEKVEPAPLSSVSLWPKIQGGIQEGSVKKQRSNSLVMAPKQTLLG
jgi:hypothetical protein